MEAWLTGAGAEPAVLVTVAIVEGSGPREAGAKMLVTADAVFDTVGGGHLEFKAIETARAMLQDGGPNALVRYALGPGLGQCCGGVVHLAFERCDAPARAQLLASDPAVDLWRLLPLHADAAKVAPAFSRTRGTHVVRDEHGLPWLADCVPAPREHVVLFGAGHVGAAIVRALSALPCQITWVDEREDMFPAGLPANVHIEATDTPEALIDQLPSPAWFLVMTHSHALDQRLAEAILSRPSKDWFGLIGSATKRVQFTRRLLARGIALEKIQAMACPIGLPGIAGKQPAVIAASVAAQLLTLWEAQSAASGAPPIRLVASRRP